MTDLIAYATDTLPQEGFFSPAEQNWLLRPMSEWVLHEEEGWLEVGSAGVDGISFAVRKSTRGIFAFYPIDRAFEWKAPDGPSLISGWLEGRITV